MATETKVYIGDTGTVLEAETDKDLTGAVTLRLEMIKPQGSALSQPLTAADTAVTVEDTSEFAGSGYAEIEDERIQYTGKTAATLTGITRGISGTKAAPHLPGAAILPMVYWAAAPKTGAASIAQHTTTAGELDRAGWWRGQVYAEWSADQKWHGNVFRFHIYDLGK